MSAELPASIVCPLSELPCTHSCPELRACAAANADPLQDADPGSVGVPQGGPQPSTKPRSGAEGKS